MKLGEKWFPEKSWKNFDLENCRSESFSIRTSERRAPASELVLQRGSLPSEIALQGGTLESKIVYRGVGADFEKPKKYFRLIMNRVLWNVEKSGFQKNYEKNLTWKIVGPSHSQYVPLRAGLPLPSSCCKGEGCLPISHYKGEAGKPRVQNCVSGRCRLRKTNKIFSANNEQSKLWNVVKSGFQKNFEKNLAWNIVGPSYSWYLSLRAGLPLPSSCCIGDKAKPAFRDRITRGKPRVQSCVWRGRCRLRKTKKIFSANNEQSTMKRGEKWLSEKT